MTLQAKILFKTCRRCKGDMYLEYDLSDEYLVCLQCGNQVEQRRKVTSKSPSIRDAKHSARE